MDTLEFLRRVLPETGLYIIDRLVDGHWRHQVCDSREEAAAYARQFDLQGVPTYHACAAYREREVQSLRPSPRTGKPYSQVRVQRNVRALRAFWMDLDVDPAKPEKFESQGAAVEGVVDFCSATKFPLPMIVSSGGGMHVYWTLRDEILPEVWRSMASGLKKLAAHHKFKADPACTTDSARVLRPVGTSNRKLAGSPRAVELVAEGEGPLAITDLQDRITQALAAIGEKPDEPVKIRETKIEQLNQEYAVQNSFPPCSGHKVAERCQQVRRMRDTRGCVPEPLWYATIQLLAHAIEGDDLIHEWSKGYDGYTREETDGKIIQVQEMGPTLCTTFADRNPGGCDGCPYKDKISSPIQLGTFIEAAPAPTVVSRVEGVDVVTVLPDVPAPFKRGAGKEGAGGVYIEEDGITLKVYEFDCFPIELAYDESRGFEVMRIRHWLPTEGWLEFTVQSSLLAKPTEFEVALRDNSVVPLIKNRGIMYFDTFARSIRASIKMKRLFRSMGWKNDDTEFVLGEKLYRPHDIVQAGHSNNANEFLANFRAHGDLAGWRALTTIFQNSDLSPHAFVLLLAFAAPFLKLAGKQGFTVAMYSDTGTGKSTMGGMLASVYGHPERSWAPFLATDNARYERLGAYNAIPAYMDEVGNLETKVVGDLLYTVATGKGKDSLTRSREARKGLDWSTILVCSTNHSLQDKLLSERANAEAESMRLFEMSFPKMQAFAEPSKWLGRALKDHYGVAGACYIENLVRHRADIVPLLFDAVDRAAIDFNMATEERFWTQAIAYALLGGALAKQWGIIDFDPDVIRPWLLRETVRMRRNLVDTAVTPLAILGQFLNDHVGERLVVTKMNAGLTTTRVPFQRLTQRWEKDNNLLYVSRVSLHNYLRDCGFDHNAVRRWLTQHGILTSTDARKVLGMGTELGGSAVPCWKLLTNKVDLGLDSAPDA